jgi:RNA polymerase sigma factor (sigma-70 family)
LAVLTSGTATRPEVILVGGRSHFLQFTQAVGTSAICHPEELDPSKKEHLNHIVPVMVYAGYSPERIGREVIEHDWYRRYVGGYIYKRWRLRGELVDTLVNQVGLKHHSYFVNRPTHEQWNYSPDRAFTPWMTTLIRRVSKRVVGQYFRQLPKHTLPLENAGVLAVLDAHTTAAEQADLWRAVEPLLDRLREQQRVCLRKLFLEEKPVGQVADEMGTYPKAVRRLAKTGLKRLRELLKQDER